MSLYEKIVSKQEKLALVGLYYSFSKYIQKSRRTCYNENGDEK